MQLPPFDDLEGRTAAYAGLVALAPLSAAARAEGLANAPFDPWAIIKRDTACSDRNSGQ